MMRKILIVKIVIVILKILMTTPIYLKTSLLFLKTSHLNLRRVLKKRRIALYDNDNNYYYIINL
jgi:hypothetical protein